MSQSKVHGPDSSSAVPTDGRSDFDFLFGSWRITNNWLTDPLNPTESAWIEFETIAVARPLLGGDGTDAQWPAAAMSGRIAV